MTHPVRIQLSRQRGFRLQEVSLALNGLPAVKVDRTTRWGNPFIVGSSGGPYAAKVVDRRHAWQLYRSVALSNDEFMAKVRAELRGKNLACWCPKDDPYEDICHAAVLLEIANV